MPKEALKQRILDLLNQVGLPARIYDMYPHELSGGMKQRVCIAMAIALNPSLIIADEPTSALDVVVQRVVAQTLLDVKKRLGVSHDPDRPRHGPAGADGGPAGRDVCRQHGRDRAGEAIFPRPLHPVHAAADRVDPVDQGTQAAQGDRGLDARPAQPAARLHLPVPLPVCEGHVPAGAAALEGNAPDHQAACHIYDQPALYPRCQAR